MMAALKWIKEPLKMLEEDMGKLFNKTTLRLSHSQSVSHPQSQSL